MRQHYSLDLVKKATVLYLAMGDYSPKAAFWQRLPNMRDFRFQNRNTASIDETSK